MKKNKYISDSSPEEVVSLLVAFNFFLLFIYYFLTFIITNPLLDLYKEITFFKYLIIFILFFSIGFSLFNLLEFLLNKKLSSGKYRNIILRYSIIFYNFLMKPFLELQKFCLVSLNLKLFVVWILHRLIDYKDNVYTKYVFALLCLLLVYLPKIVVCRLLLTDVFIFHELRYLSLFYLLLPLLTSITFSTIISLIEINKLSMEFDCEITFTVTLEKINEYQTMQITNFKFNMSEENKKLLDFKDFINVYVNLWVVSLDIMKELKEVYDRHTKYINLPFYCVLILCCGYILLTNNVYILFYNYFY